MKIIGGSRFDIEDKSKYEYLSPIWFVLENTGEKGITTKELFEQTSLDEKKANSLVNEMVVVFQNALMKETCNPLKMLGMGNDKWYDKNLRNCWVFDKLMLLATRIDTGNPDDPMDGNPFMDVWKNKWLEQRGM